MKYDAQHDDKGGGGKDTGKTGDGDTTKHEPRRDKHPGR